MFYIVWTIFNIASGILIVYLLYRLAKLIYINYGLVAAIISIGVLLCLVGSSAAKQNTIEEPQVFTFKTPDSVRYFKNDYATLLEQNPVFKIRLNMMSANDKDRINQLPVHAFSIMTGVVGYNQWSPKDVSVQSFGDQFSYTVKGEMLWKLLNYTIYREQKIYSGQIRKS